MTSTGDNHSYHVDDTEGEHPGDGESSGPAPDLERSSEEPQPIELEQPGDATAQPASEGSISDMTCPHCGAPMPGENTIVCLRCGFDLEAMAHRRTATETDDESHSPELLEEELLPAISGPGRGGLWLPASLAVAGFVVLAVGYGAGARGLFLPVPAGESITWSMRLVELLRLVINALLTGGCIVGALTALAYLEERPIGRWDLLVMRAVGIVFIMRLATFINVPITAAEWLIEAGVQLVLFVALARYLFDLRFMRSALIAAIAVMFYLIVRLLAWAV